MPVINFTVGPTTEPPGPCLWDIDTTCCEGWGDLPAHARQRGQVMATSILDGLTGRQFAQCPMDYRPCGTSCQMGNGYMVWPVGLGAVGGGSLPWMIPFVDGGRWRNCVCPGACTCAAKCSVPIPFSVAQVDRVTVDGLELDPAAYRLDAWRGVPELVRIDGECWPECQDMNAEPTEVGSFVITFKPGKQLPEAGRMAAGELACEIAKACAGAECALPGQLASMTRNGVDIEMIDPTTLTAEGRTGLRFVDLWLESVNPYRRRQPSRVRSVDSYRGRTQ